MWSVMTFSDSSSKKGACQPPYSNPPSRSSSGAPGPCRTPSNDVNMLTTSSPMTSSSMAVTSEWTDYPAARNSSPTEEGGRRLPRLGRLLQDPWPGRGAAGMVPRRPAWSSSNACSSSSRVFITKGPSAATGSRIGSPTQDQGHHRSDRAAVAGVTLQTRPSFRGPRGRAADWVLANARSSHQAKHDVEAARPQLPPQRKDQRGDADRGGPTIVRRSIADPQRLVGLDADGVQRQREHPRVRL